MSEYFCKRAKDLDLATLKLDPDLVAIIESIGIENAVMFARVNNLQSKIRRKLKATKRAEGVVKFNRAMEKTIDHQAGEWTKQFKAALEDNGYFRDHSIFSNVDNFILFVCADTISDLYNPMIEVLKFNQYKYYDCIKEYSKSFFEKHREFFRNDETLQYIVRPHLIHDKKFTKKFNSFYESFNKDKADEMITSALSGRLTPIQKELFLFAINMKTPYVVLSATEIDAYSAAIRNLIGPFSKEPNDYRRLLTELVSW